MANSILDKKSLKLPFKAFYFEWVVSPSASAGTRLIAGASPGNAHLPPSTAGYTFVSWIMFTSKGWVGSIYPASPVSETTDVWTASAKAATSGTSIAGVALYIRSDLA